MPALRGHHLICLHFFHGEGYDEAFIENLMAILERAEEQEILISACADDVCRSCPHLRDGRCLYEENADDEIRAMDGKALELLGLSPGRKVRWSTLRARIPDIFSEWFALYCRECDWRDSCEKDGFFLELKQK
ncbi:hypothetical protein BMS3Abin07_01317 [bacterium BMS3Abin07]|nr:hypothetical protein BMS3Abin07_01317 [bacterium BMS3Abin07]GBE33161.1 hypothetical protein BMS3Bbin05_02099 [bacterium BMS3Bbin05]HDL21181.1 DUF1284 domain-containing protein [Nitrospirota bacterium]HDO22645.1 DUF1284 domain-containing protein [Nitrospirota bacterium]HDZ87649.1 DUF1284 domain-containing protein [Nitrospirota bacterium]